MKRFIRELFIFGQKQARASLFAGLLLGFILFSKYVELPGLYRYDYIFIYAVIIQVLLIVYKLETRREVMVVFVFHVIATIMELFKTSDAIHSWHYPEASIIAIGNVPLFAGFMYSAVGSYIARAWKLQQLRYTNYPPLLYTFLLSVAIYINFFSHHFIYDFRYILVALTFVVFWRTRVHFTIERERSMPLLLGLGLVTVFIWIAENISTFAGVWLYPNQELAWTLVSPEKLGSWFLLVIISFVLVSLVYKNTLRQK